MRPFKRSLVEDFQGMGLSDEAVQDSLSNMLGEESEYDPDMDDFEDEDVDALDIVEAIKRVKKMRGKKKFAYREYRKSASGRAATKRAAKKARTSRQKRIRAKRRKKLARMGKARKGVRRVSGIHSSREYEGGSLTEALIENLHDLSESVGHDGGERFDQYVEAFNHIADLGELMALRYNEMGEDELAEDVIGVAILAEEILEEMEDLDGVVDVDEDEDLEEALSEAMEIVGDQLAEYSEITEDYDDEDEDDELEDALSVLEAARSRKEKGYVVTTRQKVSQGRGKKKKTVTRKRTIGHGKSGKGKFTDDEGVSYSEKDLDKFEKDLVYNRYAKGKSKSKKQRSDIKDPKGLAGYLARHGSFRR